MLLGISSFTYGWAIGVPGKMPAIPWTEQSLLDQTLRFGLHTLQIGDNLPLHSLPEERLAALKERAVLNNIRLELGARKLTHEHLHRYLVLAEYFNAPLLRFVIDSDNYTPNLDEIKNIINDSLPILKNNKVKIGIENHDRLKARDLAALMERIGSSDVGICLDCANSLGAGEGLEFVAGMLAPYTLNLHVKDFTVQRLSHNMGFIITGAETGKGMINLPLLLDLLSPYNRCESAILEQWTPPRSSIDETISIESEWAKTGVEYLKQFQKFKIS